MVSDERQHRAHVELGLMNRRGNGHGAEHIDRPLMHMRRHAFNVLRLQTMFSDHCKQCIGGGMGVAAGGVVLERGLG